MKFFTCSMWTAVALAFLAPGLSFAQDHRDKAREIFNNQKDSVVWIMASVKVEVSAAGKSLGPAQERKSQSIGTVLDPAGLVAVSLSAIDPSTSLQGRTVPIQGEDVTLSAKSEYLEVKVVMPDGTEVPASVVMTDDVLDLAFVRPEKEDPKLKFTAVKADKNPAVKVLDEILCLGRMAKGLDQAPAATLSEITAIVTKPRTFYMGGRMLGGPVFTLDGQFVGITAAYRAEGANAQPSVVIVPSEDIAKAAKEAMTKKVEPTSKPASEPELPANKAEKP